METTVNMDSTLHCPHPNDCQSNSTDLPWYGGDIFHNFAILYEPIHLPLSVIICLLGIMANTLNVIVLTRPSMLTPTNIILTGLSAAQLFLLTNYLLLLTFNVCASTCMVPELHSYAALTYKWINVNVSVAFHTTALCHTLVLAIFRFFAVKLPTWARARLTVHTAKLCVAFLHLVIPILCAPTFFTSYVALSKHENENETCGILEAFDLDYVEELYLLEAAMWIFGICFKLIPSVMIVILSFYLIISLKKYNKKKDRLTGKNNREEMSRLTQNRRSTMDTETGPSEKLIRNWTDNQNNKKRNSRRILTKMLVIVALLCVSVELPHGIVNLLTAIFGQEFGTQVYDNLGDLFEMLTLAYSSVNFILYCAMSTEFKNTFRKLFWVPVRDVWIERVMGRPAPLKKECDFVGSVRRTSCVESGYYS